jgi:hypothetical protein
LHRDQITKVLAEIRPTVSLLDSTVIVQGARINWSRKKLLPDKRCGNVSCEHQELERDMSESDLHFVGEEFDHNNSDG